MGLYNNKKKMQVQREENNLKGEIEIVREELNRAIMENKKVICKECVIEISRKLDKLIVEYLNA